MTSITRVSALTLGFLATVAAPAQVPVQTATLLQPSLFNLNASLSSSAISSSSDEASAPLPDAPMPAAAITALPSPALTRPCRASSATGPEVDSGDQDREPCMHTPNQYARFLDTSQPLPLSPAQKAHLALRELRDPGNIATITGNAAYTIATDSHTAYGPGWRGFRSLTAYSFSQDATGTFFGTFLIPSLTGQDPRYHRMPHASIPRRVLHVLASTVIAQSDYGATMPNYSNLLTNPICAEISNLYVPGVNGNGPSTVSRVLTGYATSPIDTMVTEFLPDVARRVHIHVIFVQRILNQVSNDQYPLQ